MVAVVVVLGPAWHACHVVSIAGLWCSQETWAWAALQGCLLEAWFFSDQKNPREKWCVALQGTPNMKHDIETLQSGYVDTYFLAILKFPVKNIHVYGVAAKHELSFLCLFRVYPHNLLMSNTGSLGQRTRLLHFMLGGIHVTPVMTAFFCVESS